MIPQKERARAAATGASSRNASDLLVGWIAEERYPPYPQFATAFLAAGTIFVSEASNPDCRAGIQRGSAMSADRKPSTAYTLSLLRCINRRLQHITEEVNAVGVALDNGLIDAMTAREMAEQIAPGCLDAVALSVLEGAPE